MGPASIAGIVSMFVWFIFSVQEPFLYLSETSLFYFGKIIFPNEVAKEELKSLLMRVKEESESGPTTSW